MVLDYEKSSEFLPFQYIIDQPTRLSIYLARSGCKDVDFVADAQLIEIGNFNLIGERE